MERYPTFERKAKQDNNALIIITVILVIIVIIGAIIVYAVFRPVNALGSGICEPGVCACSVATGVKRCPANSTSQVTYNIAFEVCTSENFCQDTRLPCAVLKDGTLNCLGNCGDGNSGCRCAKSPTQIK
jgi:hypothetical protein